MASARSTTISTLAGEDEQASSRRTSTPQRCTVQASAQAEHLAVAWDGGRIADVESASAGGAQRNPHREVRQTQPGINRHIAISNAVVGRTVRSNSRSIGTSVTPALCKQRP